MSKILICLPWHVEKSRKQATRLCAADECGQIDRACKKCTSNASGYERNPQINSNENRWQCWRVSIFFRPIVSQHQQSSSSSAQPHSKKIIKKSIWSVKIFSLSTLDTTIYLLSYSSARCMYSPVSGRQRTVKDVFHHRNEAPDQMKYFVFRQVRYVPIEKV